MQNLSRQAKIDKVMCKPGYTWNETIKRCLGPAESIPTLPDGGEKPATPELPAVDSAIKQEKAKRAQPAPPPKAVK